MMRAILQTEWRGNFYVARVTNSAGRVIAAGRDGVRSVAERAATEQAKQLGYYLEEGK